MSKEMELKLRCTELLDWAQVSKVLDLHVCGPRDEPKIASLHNRYFDTPTLDLHKQKVALRIRKKPLASVRGEGGVEKERVQYIQTLKTAGRSVNGISQRGEWEWDLSSSLEAPEGAEPKINTSLLETVDAWAEQIEVDASKLIPIFSTDFQRTAQLIEWKGYRFELVLDQGAVTVPGKAKTIPINEIEIEYCEVLGSGSGFGSGPGDHELAPEDALRELGELLCAKLPLEPEDASKAQRGYALFRAS
jgi:inorganic triphosphatase YgiF